MSMERSDYIEGLSCLFYKNEACTILTDQCGLFAAMYGVSRRRSQTTTSGLGDNETSTIPTETFRLNATKPET